MEYKYPINGKFGIYGGQFVPEVLMPAVHELEAAYKKVKDDTSFKRELEWYLAYYAGRPTPTYLAKNLTKFAGGAKIYLKREDLLHGGAHKINNTLGQALLAKYMKKGRVIAETGAGQHGVATAMACAALGLQAEVYMGSEDIKRQEINVYRMTLLGAKVHKVDSGSRTLKDAINEALRDWVTNLVNTHYLIGSVVGPHPYPMIVRDFQSVIGKEIKRDMMKIEGRAPDAIVACVGGGSNSMGSFYPFIEDQAVKLVGVEAGGHGNHSGSAALLRGREGVLHGMLSHVLEDSDGQIDDTYSIAAGLDYSAVGPEHSYLMKSGRVRYTIVNDSEAIVAFRKLSLLEGIIPALESSHAIAEAIRMARDMNEKQSIVVTLSGRGDKDVQTIINRGD